MALAPRLSPRLSPRLRHRLRYAVPGAAVVATVIATVMPQAASGSEHPVLPTKTAAQLLAAVEQAHIPDFTGTTVETARLGLPTLPDGALAGAAGGSESQVQQVVTLLTGSHTARLAYAGPEQQRAAIFLDDLSETDVVHNGKDLWTYSSRGNAVTHTTLTDDHPDHPDRAEPAAAAPLDPTQAAEHALARIDPSTAVTVDPTARIAGRPAYQLVLAPRDARSLIGSIRIAVDAATSMPLRVQVWPRAHTAQPAFEVGFTSLTLRTPSASTFAFSVPPHATVNAGTNRAPLPGIAGRRADVKAAGGAAGPAPSDPSSTTDSTTTIGKDWLSIVTGTLPSDQTAPPVPASGPEKAVRAPDVSHMLDQIATAIPGGRLITTALVTVLITNDNHFYIGAVDPTYLRTVAAQGHA